MEDIYEITELTVPVKKQTQKTTRTQEPSIANLEWQFFITLDEDECVSLTKNIKRKEPVISLLNKEIIEGMTAPLYSANEATTA